ncbi:catechol 2,3-dioxygenase-like lactoylglutathione lyase family enzyme [Bradyrhizobium japonicum]|nr:MULTISPECIES: VOC family protein [Bradyrhizobium]MCA1398997.1 VOC family protein [Bradyrhizobium sp. BRP56]MBP2435114.1 glyoxylase I family protein [Bradyrhizobium elkanii]MCP1737711.1 glyoxylase I family protein [Bradyrhizobium elkanii]MCS3575870.1 glyoxylase I family protein [Bradyrhizobium elkanii]MCS3594792.1 glyoxylase I family protein [Bradyrhizobium elkanii]
MDLIFRKRGMSQNAMEAPCQLDGAAMEKPNFLEADHVSWTVPDLDAAISFYCDVFGATELFRLGPLDAADLPRGTDGRDWMESHVNVAEARLKFAMLKLTPNLKFQLVQYDKPEQRRFDLPRNCDRGGHHLGLRVDDVGKAASYLAAHGCTVLDAIYIDAGPLAGKTNLYVLDPWGHQLEIVD